MATRTSSRHAAQKAKEAISTSAEPTGKTSKGTKRRASGDEAPQPKKEKTEDIKPDELKKEEVPGTSVDRPVQKTEEASVKTEEAPVKTEEPPEGQASTVKPVESHPEKPQGIEGGLHKSEERENLVPSNILEKGFIYFFFRPRVDVDEPESFGDVARSFFVLRPTALGAEFDNGQDSVEKDASCRLMILPKKKFPTSSREREMGFVEKAGQSMQALHDNFIAGKTYQTSTRGERHTEAARPYAEGVYAITSAPRASHLAYILTIPAELGDVQEDFGLQERGSWIVQSKSPKFPGPPVGQLPKNPEFPPSVLEKFGDLRWVPLQPEFLDYPYSQFLMIGSAQNDLGKAASSMGDKQPKEEEPGQELEKMADEDEHRVDSLQGDATVYEDLGYHAKNYPKVPTTWNA